MSKLALTSVKSRVKVEIKIYLTNTGSMARVFLIRYLSDFKKQIKQNLAYFYTKNSKNRHNKSVIFRLFLEFNRDFIPLPISVQDFEQR